MRCDVAAVRLFLLALLCPVAAVAAQQAAKPPRSAAAFDSLLAGMACKQHASGRMDCDFRVGGARFVIAGVGQEDATVTFVQADSTNSFVAGIVPLHGCVVVKPAHMLDATRAAAIPSGDSVATFAFVSPKTGKVYRNWQTCLSATRADARVAEDAAAPKMDAKPDTSVAAKPSTAKTPATKATTTKPATDAKAPPPARPPR